MAHKKSNPDESPAEKREKPKPFRFTDWASI
jgi:hypothetical protein